MDLQQRYEFAYEESYQQVLPSEDHPWCSHSHGRDFPKENCDLRQELKSIEQKRIIPKNYKPPNNFFHGLLLFVRNRPIKGIAAMSRLHEFNPEQDPYESGAKRGREDAQARMKLLGWDYLNRNGCNFGLCSHGAKCQYCNRPCCNWDHTQCCSDCESEYEEDHGYPPYRK